MVKDLWSLEMLPEGFIDNLCDGQAVQVCLASDGLDPAALDVEGDAVGLLGGIAGLGEGVLATLPPGREFLKDRYQTDNHVIGGRSLNALLAGCSHGRLSRARVYTRCTPTYTEVYNRCTQVYKRLFAQCLTERTGFLQVIGIHELVVFLEGCLGRIIQHIRRSGWLAPGSKELTDPQGTEQMRVASFPGPFQDKRCEILPEAPVIKWNPRCAQKHIGTGRGIGKAWAKDREIFLKVDKKVGEIGSHIEAKGIDPAVTLTDFEFLAPEGQPPMPLPVLIQIAIQLHFADIALPHGNTKQEPEHEGSAMLSRTNKPLPNLIKIRTILNRLMSILQFTQGNTFKVIAVEQKIMLVMHRLGERKRPLIVLQCLDLGMFEVSRKTNEFRDSLAGLRRATHAETFPLPYDKGIETIHAEEIIPVDDWLVGNVVQVAQICRQALLPHVECRWSNGPSRFCGVAVPEGQDV
jgi:hypothetical protein